MRPTLILFQMECRFNWMYLSPLFTYNPGIAFLSEITVLAFSAGGLISIPDRLRLTIINIIVVFAQSKLGSFFGIIIPVVPLQAFDSFKSIYL